ncbi:hypothetical protein R75461_07674 [Paraburkholderia nemoris]|uniref:hypothetical protein n=1 Tax=Paraburkholderia nemoris TaxID=2793076 RepID=UPI00190B0176|nr:MULTISPECIES: hypothetical protein [Paraburkholderia]MBK3786436.1 hypothetical protein [Paraburkholderia aspalathi]CAE6855266.1 hypothetical protein R75461_07674 [Paraburkholderia nemoris]
MNTVIVPKSLLEKFSWDERRQEYFALIPKDRLDGAVSYTRFRVEFRPEGGVVLIPQ